MLPEIELVQTTNNIFLVLWVLVVQVLDELGLDQSLLVESLLVLEYLESAVLSILVIKALEDHSKTALANFLDDFPPVGEMLVDLAEVLIGIGIEAIISLLVEYTHF